ncbi:MAG: phosphoribosylformylglycinamidine synthase [Mariprofundaceae bacterium]|nr:phosphoribosylformylglycinamidine synthase [Mariprofundaceae bacterium]
MDSYRTIRLRGANALSEFRSKQLIKKLSSVMDVQWLHAEYIYVAALNKHFSEEEHVVLEQILHEQDIITPTSYGQGGHQVIVSPRLGTISPWSSKATDIALACGLDQVIRLERAIIYRIGGEDFHENKQQCLELLHDRMTETVFEEEEELDQLFSVREPAPLVKIDILKQGIAALNSINIELGLALSDEENRYLFNYFDSISRNPTDVELMMFAQANSEHCRHKIFNAHWVIDGKEESKTLFSMIRHTHKKNPEGTLVAYSDNSSVIQGTTTQRFFPQPFTKVYAAHEQETHILMKVETHNHPTAISPFSGAATGSGGEIRDEGATGCGSKPKVGLSGFIVSNLQIPDFIQPWEKNHGKPNRIASALDIMLQAPIGSASFNNEFGRPNILGFFRTYEQQVQKQLYGYHKPVMLAGGLGSIAHEHVKKKYLSEGGLIIQLGGPAMLIGLGGGAASSMDTGNNAEDLDFNSVQRGNPEMQRRCQEVLDGCWQMEDKNPIRFIHDIGAGGLSNALPELVHDAGRGGIFKLRSINNLEPGMSPMQIWCNEAQERYVLAIDQEHLSLFKDMCERERCPFAVVGKVTNDTWLRLHDEHFDEDPIDIPLSVLFGKAPRMTRDVTHVGKDLKHFNTKKIQLEDAIERVLRLPSVGDKSFLITIADRSVGGMVTRDQMVGPWQVPVADVAVSSSDFHGYTGEAMSIGERTPVAVLDGSASGRLAVAEAITNIAAARIKNIGDIKLSANWMAACGHEGEDADLFDTVKAVAMELCPELGISIPVGKDSLSMKTAWDKKNMASPLSLIISAFSPVCDVRQTLTPELRMDQGDTELLLIDLGEGRNRLGGSALAQVYEQTGDTPPDLNKAALLKAFFYAIQDLNEKDYLLAYHDRSDGGLLTTICEMAFATSTGIEVSLDALGDDAFAALFSEEPGAVMQIRRQDREAVLSFLINAGLGHISHIIGKPRADKHLIVSHQQKLMLDKDIIQLQRSWSETSYRMQSLRDNPACAKQAFDKIGSPDAALQSSLSFDPTKIITAPMINHHKPRIAILREQGINGQVEMAAAFERVQLEAVDVHMSDILSSRIDLKDFQGLAACGGFSFGDVLGAGQGWAKSILFHNRSRDMFEQFFHRDDTFALGVCNGCQMMSHLRDIIPGTANWPNFVRNESEQFEARLSLVEIKESPSIMMQGMFGSRLPIVISHGEGRVQMQSDNLPHVAMAYVDTNGTATEHYPNNPNGSPMGITGVTNDDGRITIMMPHPERCFRTVQMSWHPNDWEENSPWLQMFANAQRWLAS